MDESLQGMRRIEELEIQLAFQEDLLQTLNDAVVRLQQLADLQQAQLRLLYQRLPEKNPDDVGVFDPSHEIPPHY
ncbi:SlyX family protein [Snodgrassella sp. CFCC 13594]|uniref:SlyX family protein n=1 Tax=Snodgrassella sp. CFCC 13594 TaxID=1775559 RepID=UPI00082E8469|nr:SlyX family protein [Snodgrassella sp. CFCC 13594]